MGDTIQDESPRGFHVRYIILPVLLVGIWALYAFLVYMVIIMTDITQSDIGFFLIVSGAMVVGFLPATAWILEALGLPHLATALGKIIAWVAKHW